MSLRSRAVARSGLAGALLAVSGAAALAGAAGASTRHGAGQYGSHGGATLIDTDLVVGSPQHGPALTWASRATSRSGRHGSEAPVITSQPKSETVAPGATASFSAAASGSPAPSVQWQVSTNGGSSFAPISGATSTTYSFAAQSAQSGEQFEAVFSNSYGQATTDAATLTVGDVPVESSNWSGYANSGTTFEVVDGTWTVPSVSCSGRGSSYSAAWIGIDGYSSDTVEQDGTEQDCLNGSPSYDAWYEMYGDSAVNGGDEVELSPSTNPVSPGDSLTASVSVSGGGWTLTLADTSSADTGWTYSTVVAFSGAAQSSAEWVVERPEICSRSCQLTSLADFGTVTFSGASTTTTAGSTGSIGANPDTAMEMVNGSTVLARPSGLASGGAGFTDTWQAA